MKSPADKLPLRAKAADPASGPSENAWLMAVAIAFLIVHIVAGTLPAPRAATSTTEQEVRSAPYD
jgi:hypothetical protein